MYTDYYRLSAKPFGISPDPGFLWMGEKHREALAILEYGLRENKGFLLLTGDVGTGKTTLINALTKTIGPEVCLANVSDPGMETLDFLNYVARCFEMGGPFSSKGAFLGALSEFLHHARKEGKTVLLIIDEAQRLSPELLEEIRVLSNIETPEAKLIHIFLVGQSEFNDLLKTPQSRALRQRIGPGYHIEPLSRAETETYIDHRLTVAGCPKNPFSGPALEKIHQTTGGLPRLINVLCDHALLTGYVKEKPEIDAAIIRECAGELHLKNGERRIPSTAPKGTGLARVQRAAADRRVWVVVSVLMAMAIGAGLWGQLLIWSAPRDQGHAVSRQTSPKPARSQADAVSPASSAAATAASEKAPAGQVVAAESAAPKEPRKIALFPEKARTDALVAEKKKADIPPKPHLVGPTVIRFKKNTVGLDESARKEIGPALTQMLAMPDVNAVIRGYTDSRGPKAYNRRISKERADMVKGYLTDNGIASKRIRTEGRGPESPLASNDTAEGRWRNRRVEIELER